MTNDDKVRANYQDIAEIYQAQIVAYSTLLDAALMVLDEVEPEVAAVIRADREQVHKAVAERVAAFGAGVSLDLIQAEHALARRKTARKKP
jgi:hypothetical protein